MKTRTYATQVKSMIEESNSQWTGQTLNIKTENKTPDQIKAEVMIVKTDSEAQLNKLVAMKAPRKAKALEIKTKDYFTTARDATDKIISWAEYGKIGQDMITSFQALGSTKATTPQQMISLFEQMHNLMSDTLKKLENANPPDIYKEANTKMIQTLEKMDQIIVQMTDALRNQDVAKLTKLASDLQTASKELSGIKTPDSSKILGSIVTEEVKDKLKNYPAEIKAEADTLTKTGFSL